MGDSSGRDAKPGYDPLIANATVHCHDPAVLPAVKVLRPLLQACIDARRRIECFLPLEGNPATELRSEPRYCNEIAFQSARHATAALRDMLLDRFGFGMGRGEMLLHASLSGGQNLSISQLWPCVNQLATWFDEHCPSDGERPTALAPVPTTLYKAFFQATEVVCAEAAADDPQPEAKEIETQRTLQPVIESKFVQLFGPGEQPRVRDKKKPILTKARYDVVAALIRAGEAGLHKDTLAEKSKHSEPQKRLYELVKDQDWKSVICLPGKNGQGKGYRIL